MKKVLSAMIMVVFAASAALAAAPDTVTMKAKNGDVTFNHKAHAAAGDCKACHGESAPAKLTLGKDAAHKLCKECHQAKKAGPTKCGECHKK
ncbi:MAG TPA: cytochrome c3 family protein [Geobacteraceae bacterium]|nr:cytochrome c3 family protein [Geobacteraceae bacterium]